MIFPAGARHRTFAKILEINRGAGPGFDLLRLCLALSIVASHCSSLVGNKGFLSHFLSDIFHAISPGGIVTAQPESAAVAADHVSQGIAGPARPYTLSRVPMFFALSGFLVAGSAFRTKRLIPFLGLRVIRILPALLVEVCLSAIVLGGIFTTMSASAYYTSPGFFSYFLNIIGDVHFNLPGVFVEHNVSPTVNGNLWTLPAEFHSYAVTALLIVSGLLFSRTTFTWIFGACTLLLALGNLFYGYGETVIGLDGIVSVYYFFVGVLFFLWKEKIPHSLPLFAVCLIAAYFLMLSNRTVYIYPALLTYVTIFIGLSALPQFKLLKSGDYSYGFYLYSYPITQALIASVPSLRGNLFAVLASTIVVTGVFAFLSWHLVEKRFLVLKRFLSPGSANISEKLHPESLKPSLLPKAEAESAVWPSN